jgi:uncharacterized membrane protein YhdT
MYSLQLPFWLAAVCAALPLVFIQFYVQKSIASDTSQETTRGNPRSC